MHDQHLTEIKWKAAILDAILLACQSELGEKLDLLPTKNLARMLLEEETRNINGISPFVLLVDKGERTTQNIQSFINGS